MEVKKKIKMDEEKKKLSERKIEKQREKKTKT